MPPCIPTRVNPTSQHLPKCHLAAALSTYLASMPPHRSHAECPNCHRPFDTAAAIVRHLNNPYSSCTLWFLPPDSRPNPPPTVQDNPEVLLYTFPSSGDVFGQGQGFMETFHMDKFSECRSENIYYPFTSREEWELAAFLTQTDLSMSVIDEFLSLELVRLSMISVVYPPYPTFTRYNILASLSRLQKHCVSTSNSFPVGLSGYHGKLTFPATLQRIQSLSTTVILLNPSNGFFRICYTLIVSITPQNTGSFLMAAMNMGTGSQATTCGSCRWACAA